MGCMSKISAARLKPISFILMQCTLAFFISYGAIMWEVALNIKYYFIVLFVFLIFCIHIYLTLKAEENTTFLNLIIRIIKFLKPFDLVIFFFLITCGVWIFIIPKLKGFLSSLAIQESGILIILVLYFPMAILIRMREINYKFIVKVFSVVTLILAIWYVLIWNAEMHFPGAYQGFFDFLNNIPGPIFKAGQVYQGWSSVRIVLANSILLVSGLLLTLGKKKEYNLIDYLVIFIYSFAILCTYLKSLWVGLIAGILVLVMHSLINKDCRKTDLWKGIVTALISVIILNFTVFGGSISTRFIYGFSNSYKSNQTTSSAISLSGEESSSATNKESSSATNKTANKAESSPTSSGDKKELFEKNKIVSDTTASNTEKLLQINKLLGRWKQSPLVGFGYGSYIKDYLRSQTVQYAYEMTSFSLLMKVGIIGMIFWLLLLFGPCFRIYRQSMRGKINKSILWLSVFLAYIISIQTNPLLFTSCSISLLLFLTLYSVYCELDERSV